jgi:hypothetical protein
MFSSRQGDKNVTILESEDINELFFMCHIDNLDGILANGLLSHKRAHKQEKTVKQDVSNNEVQQRRATRYIERVKNKPHGNNRLKSRLNLHRFAPLYLNPHNAMMNQIVRKHRGERLCIIRVFRDILDRGDVVLSSHNASVNATSFFEPGAFLLEDNHVQPLVNPSLWNNSNAFKMNSKEYYQRRQAEALVPHRIDPSYIGGIFVYNKIAQKKVNAILKNKSLKLDANVIVHPSLFAAKRLQSFESLNRAQQTELNEALPSSDSDSETEFYDFRQTDYYSDVRFFSLKRPSNTVSIPSSSSQSSSSSNDSQDKETDSNIRQDTSQTHMSATVNLGSKK